MLPHIILILSVVCTVGICEICPISFFFFRVSNLLLWAPSAANNNLIDTLPFIYLYMSQIPGSCGHLKGKYDSHSSCINYTPGIFADGYIVFAFPFVRSLVCSFVLPSRS